MRCFSSWPQISESRPDAVIANSLAGRARTSRNRLKASAAASNAGPRFAEVAGSRIRNAASLRRALMLLQCFQDGVRVCIQNNGWTSIDSNLFCVPEQISAMKLDGEIGIFQDVACKNQDAAFIRHDKPVINELFHPRSRQGR